MKQLQTLYAVGALVAGMMAGASAWAAGTPVGTLIRNSALATYTIGSVTSTVQSNTNTVKVDQLVGLAIAALGSTNEVIGQANAVLTYQLTNTGNGADSFDLTGTPNVTGNTFNATLQSVAIDSNGNGVYDPGVDTVIANGGASQVLAPDTSIKVFVLVTAPASATGTQTSQVRLTGTSVIGSGQPGTLLTGKGVGGVDAVIGLSGGTANALAGLTANVPYVTLTKSAAILDPAGLANPVAGAIITYAIVAHAGGTGTATGLTVSDPFPVGTTYQPGTLTLNGVALSDAADGDAGVATSKGIAVVLGNVAGGSPDATITFKVKIN